MPRSVTLNNVTIRAEEPITFDLTFSQRKSLSLIVDQKGRVHIRAPWQCSSQQIARFLIEKEAWIKAQQAHFDTQSPPPTVLFCQGEEHPFMGGHYPLLIEKSSPNRVELLTQKGFLLSCTKPDSPDVIKRVLDSWYRKQAQGIFMARLEALALPLGIEPDTLTLKIRKMRRRWGSCRKNGQITLNLELIKAPIECLDFVINHELCHLYEFNHSPAFYQHLVRVMPHWQEIEQKLQAFDFMSEYL